MAPHALGRHRDAVRLTRLPRRPFLLGSVPEAGRHQLCGIRWCGAQGCAWCAGVDVEAGAGARVYLGDQNRGGGEGLAAYAHAHRGQLSRTSRADPLVDHLAGGVGGHHGHRGPLRSTGVTGGGGVARGHRAAPCAPMRCASSTRAWGRCPWARTQGRTRAVASPFSGTSSPYGERCAGSGVEAGCPRPANAGSGRLRLALAVRGASACTAHRATRRVALVMSVCSVQIGRAPGGLTTSPGFFMSTIRWSTAVYCGRAVDRRVLASTA